MKPEPDLQTGSGQNVPASASQHWLPSSSEVIAVHREGGRMRCLKTTYMKNPLVPLIPELIKIIFVFFSLG